MKKRIILTASLVTLVIFLTFGSIVAAKAPDTTNPLEAIWATINSFWDSATGTLTASKLAYSTPRTHQLSLPPAAFTPAFPDVKYINTSSGVWIDSGSANSPIMMSAPFIPGGAVLSGLKAYFKDNSDSNIVVSLHRLSLADGVDKIMSEASSAGITGYGGAEGKYNGTTTINVPTIDNAAYTYSVIVEWTGSSTDVPKLLGVVITYTIDEAE